MGRRVRTFRCYINVDHCGEDNLVGILRRMGDDIEHGRYDAFPEDGGFIGNCELPSGETVGNYEVCYEPEAIAV